MNIPDEKQEKNKKRTKILVLGSIGTFLVAATGVAVNLTQIIDWLHSHRDEQESSVVEQVQEESAEQTDKSDDGMITDITEQQTEKQTEPSVTETAAPVPTGPKKVKLSSLDYYYTTVPDGMFVIKATQKDNVGNDYPQALVHENTWPYSTDEAYGGNYSDYYLNRKYSKMTGTVFITDILKDYNMKAANFIIYCDGNQVYCQEMKENLPQQFEIDVSECESMRIQIVQDDWHFYQCFNNLIGLSAELEEK